MKVLLVEDDVKIARAIRRGLEGEGFTVEVAGDGNTGLWLANEGGFDAVVLDLLLPRRNGYRVCAEMRAAGNWTPVLVLTAKAGELDETELLDTGADDFLSKPFSFPVLVARLRALLRRSARTGPEVVRVGALEIDGPGREVRKDGSTLGLTAREFDVLEFLVRRRDRVVSKAEILRGVWASDFEGDPNIVEVYVGRLRRRSVPIETVRGAGYRVRHDGA